MLIKTNQPKASITQPKSKIEVSFLDVLQSNILLTEFENILTIKRGKMMPALKIEQIYEKIYSIESILNSAVKESDSGLSLDNMKEFALNLGALQMVNMLPHMDLIPVET